VIETAAGERDRARQHGPHRISGRHADGDCGRKAAIIKRGVPAVCAEQVPEAMAVIEAQARGLRAPLHAAGQQWQSMSSAEGWLSGRSRPDGSGRRPAVVRGRHQFDNANGSRLKRCARQQVTKSIAIRGPNRQCRMAARMRVGVWAWWSSARGGLRGLARWRTNNTEGGARGRGGAGPISKSGYRRPLVVIVG